MAQILEYIFIQYHIPPDEVMQKTEGTRAFMFAAAIHDIESGRARLACPFLSK
jgi:hypothetical protein